MEGGEEVKLSKRAGTIITLEELVEKVQRVEKRDSRLDHQNVTKTNSLYLCFHRKAYSK